MIDPDDPKLPMEWRKQPRFFFEIALLSQRQPLGWVEGRSRLEDVFPGWYVDTGIEAYFSGFPNQFGVSEDYQYIFATLSALRFNHLEEAIELADEFFKTEDFQKNEGVLKGLFAGMENDLLTSEQRQSLVLQLGKSVSQPKGQASRWTFTEIRSGYAVAGAIFDEVEYPTNFALFEAPNNPVLTLVGREVVVCEDSGFDEPVARGVLEIDGGRLRVGGWSQDFSDSEVNGRPFEEVELIGDSDRDEFTIIEKAYFQKNY